MARKPRAAAPPAPDPLAAVEAHLLRGEFAPAIGALLPALDRRAAEGDRACALAAQLLRRPPASTPGLPLPPDALAAALDRLVQLVQRQEEQIRALHGLIEEAL